RPGCGATRHLVWCLRRGRRDACCPCRQDVRATIRVCANDKQMAALELGVGVPVPIEQAGENLRLYLALLQLVVALLIAPIIFAIRIHRRHKHHVLSIRRPDCAVGARRDPCYLPWFPNQNSASGVKIAHPNLRRIGCFRCPDEPFAVGRKPWPFLMVWSWVEPARFAASR